MTLLAILQKSNKSFVYLIKSLYRTIIKRVHTSSVLEESELDKIIENAQRYINIGFINEIVMICHKLNIDPKNIINKTNIRDQKRIVEFENIKIDLNKQLIFKNKNEYKINNTEKNI